MPRVNAVPIPADAAVDALRAGSPGHRPGVVLSGSFRASSIAATYSRAGHFNGMSVPVTVRFFNDGDGSDATRMPRGMAVRFQLGALEDALIGTTLPVSVAKTAADLLEFRRATAPQKVRPMPWDGLVRLFELVVGNLKLLPPDPNALPGDKVMVAFADRVVPARLAVAATTLLRVPESYATCCYHVVDAVRLTSGDATTTVRFNWAPVAGVLPAPAGTRGDFLRAEMAERLVRSPVEFVLRAQVAEAGDDTNDPTTKWSESRRLLIMGELRLDTLLPATAGAESMTSSQP